MSKGSSTPADTTTTTKPFPAQEKALTELFGMSQAAFDAGPQQFYPGQTVADQGFNTLAGQQLGLDAAGIQGGLGMQAAQNLGSVQSGLLAPARTVSAVGSQQGAYNQALINADRERFKFNQEAPETALDRLGSRITGVNLGQISNTSGGGGGGNSAASAVGAGMAAYGLFGGGGGS